MKMPTINRQQTNPMFVVWSKVIIDRECITHLIYVDRYFEQFKSSH